MSFESKELLKRVHVLMTQLIGNEKKNHSSATINELYLLHNLIYPLQRKNPSGCSGCRRRIYQRVLGWYNEHKDKI
jgi:hypothetical protein